MPPILKNRGATKRILPLALMDPSAFLREMGRASHSVVILFFSHKTPVDAGDISSTIYFSSGVDDLKGLFIREEGD